MNINLLSTQYEIKKITEDDIFEVLALCKGNPLYYMHCPPEVTIEGIKNDIIALPPNITYSDKFYIGFYKADRLIAVMDLICHYPNDKTAFIGFFMVKNSFQGVGVGSAIISEGFQYLKSIGYEKIRLGYVKDNLQAKSFWDKNLFMPTGVENTQEFYTIVVMEKTL